MDHTEDSPLPAFIVQNKLASLLFLISLLLVVCGLMLYFARPKPSSEEITFDLSTTKSPVSPSSPSISESLTIDIAGGVVKPGVYQLLTGSRIQDAILKAGGLSQSADTKLIASTINLASKLKDGSKIYIPILGEDTPATTGVLGDSYAEERLININTASESELDTLAGVGKTTATKIISNRPYQVINELVNKKVVGEKVFSQIKDHITTE